MLKRFLAVALTAMLTGCAVTIQPPQPPAPPDIEIPVPDEPESTVPDGQLLAFDLNACVDPQCVQPIAGATFQIQQSPTSYLTVVANAAGYVLVTMAPVPVTRVVISAEGYITTAVEGFIPSACKDGCHNIFQLQANHVDPSGIPLEQLARIRGAMWPQTLGDCNNLSLGPRPGQPTNILATDFITDYSPAEQDCIIATLKARGYTHVVMGPLVDSDGYHGMWQPNDWRDTNFSRFLDAVQKFWDNNLVPIVFLHPDGWSLSQTKDELTPLLLQPRAQRLIRLVVPHGWEPCRYECSSYTWAGYGRWARESLPNALVLLHTVADIDAPVGTDSLGDDNGHSNAEGWARVAPFYHGWLTQSSAFDKPQEHGDRNLPDRTNFQNWQDLFNPHVRGSYRDRFETGYAGWPMFSAWGDRPLLVYAGEYSAYWRFWGGRAEAEGVQWGDAAIAAGAYGYLDSGSVPVP